MLNNGRNVRGDGEWTRRSTQIFDRLLVYFIRFILGVCRRIMVGSLVCRHETKYSNFIMIVKVLLLAARRVSLYYVRIR